MNDVEVPTEESQFDDQLEDNLGKSSQTNLDFISSEEEILESLLCANCAAAAIADDVEEMTASVHENSMQKSTGDNSNGELSNNAESYHVFRKCFYVPYKWTTMPDMLALASHRYLVSNAQSAFEEICSHFRKLGYDNGTDNNNMIHDYVHFVLCDLFMKRKATFIMEAELRKDSPLYTMMQCTPDIILKRGKDKKPIIIDIYVGKKDTSSVKSKYRGFSIMFDFLIVTEQSLTADLKSLVDDNILLLKDVDFLFKNLQVFLTEHRYWVTCLKLQKILRNSDTGLDIENVSAPDEEFFERQLQFINKLNNKAVVILDHD
jgi:hypothetical protein